MWRDRRGFLRGRKDGWYPSQIPTTDELREITALAWSVAAFRDLATGQGPSAEALEAASGPMRRSAMEVRKECWPRETIAASRAVMKRAEAKQDAADIAAMRLAAMAATAHDADLCIEQRVPVVSQFIERAWVRQWNKARAQLLRDEASREADRAAGEEVSDHGEKEGRQEGRRVLT